MKAEKSYQSATIKKLPESEMEITGSVSTATFAAYRSAALKNVNTAVTIAGFRPGNVPEKILIAKVGEKTILEEMAELAISDAYPAIVLDHALDPVGRPEIRITKMASDNPLEFTIRTAVMPEVTLGDYQKIARETPIAETKHTIEEKEVNEALARIKKSNMGEGHENGGHDHAGHDHAGHDHASFDTPEFRQKIREALVENKRMEAVEKRRIAMADTIIETAVMDLPRILVEKETDRIEAQFKDDISRMNVNLDDYLKSAKKTLDDLRKEWSPHAEKKAKLQLALNKIAAAEKIRAEEKEIEAEVAHILEHYKDADREQARIYATGVLSNEKVFQFLEKLAGENSIQEEKNKRI